MERQQGRGYRSPEKAGDGDGQHEAREQAASLGRRHPLAQKQNDPREKPRFSHPKQEAEPIELKWGGHEGHQRGNHTPSQEDATDPSPCPHPIENQIAGNLEKHVTEKENPRSKAIGGRVQTKIPGNPFGSERNIDAIEVGDHVHHKQQRQQMPAQRRHGVVKGLLSHRPDGPYCGGRGWLPIIASILRMLCRVVLQTSFLKPGSHWSTSCSIDSPRSKASQSWRSSRARSMKFQRFSQAGSWAIHR